MSDLGTLPEVNIVVAGPIIAAKVKNPVVNKNEVSIKTIFTYLPNMSAP